MAKKSTLRLEGSTPSITTTPLPPPPRPGNKQPPVGSTPQAPRPRHHRVRWTFVTLGALLVVVLLTGGWLVYRAVGSINTHKDGSNAKLSFFQQVAGIVTHNDALLQGEREDRINILLLGIGGPGHEGPYLTDTMIVASIQPSTKQVAMISIPRDLVVDIPGYDYRKINSVLSIGRDQEYPGGGEALVMKIVGDVLDIPIHYYARIDFQGFEEVIDKLGGVTVNVERSFADYQYPDNNYGYQTVRFKAGEQTMDGKTALEFARSRKGTNGEGSDFARAARQQKILVAVRDKALSLGTLLNPVKINDLLSSLANHHQTNLEVSEMLRLAKMVGSVNADNVISKVLDNSTNGFLHAATGLQGAYILEPNDDTYGDIRFLANNIFLIGAAEREAATVVVGNATSTEGLAGDMTQALDAFGLTTVSPISLPGITTDHTVLIDQSQGKYPKTLELLGLYAHAHGSLTLASWVNQTQDTTLPTVLATPSQSALNENTNSNGNTNTDTKQAVNIALVLGNDQISTLTNN